MARTVLDRRTFLAAAATGIAGLAGCGGSGNSGGPGRFGGWMEGVSNYDGVVDRTDADEVTVMVGARGNGGAFAFEPAAVKVSTGTTVVWEWTGEGGGHNVNAIQGASFKSNVIREAGHTFTQTLQEPATIKYQCDPHASLGMKGVVVVE